MPPINNMYVYTNPPGANPILGPLSGDFNANLYRLNCANNAAGLQANVVYQIKQGLISPRAKASPATLTSPAPPSYVFTV